MAALGIGHRVETLAYEVAEGYEIATAALVGQNLGARRPRRGSSGGPPREWGARTAARADGANVRA